VDGDGASAVAEMEGADAVKVALADAGFTEWPTPRLDLADLAEIAEEAATRGLPVYAHVDEEEDVADALAAGVEVLAHPVFGGLLAHSADAPVHSTIGAFAGTGDLLDGSLLAEDLAQTPEAVRDAWTWLAAHPEAFTEGWIAASETWEENAQANLALAIAEGREVMAGSDAGYWFVPHGLGLHRELEALVALGMTPLEALAAATSVPASRYGWSDLGFIDAGYRADLLVVDGRPDEDIRAARAVEQVWLAGMPLEDEELLIVPSDGEEGDFCLDDRDCAGVCDLIRHTCAQACEEPYDRVGSCDEATACLPQDGLDETKAGVCHPGDACDLYAQDCTPEAYGENCVPLDIDTNRCWPAGPRVQGESCSWSDASAYCAQGLFCSWVTWRCYPLCDPDDPGTCASCIRQYVEGEPWFGLCI
jgi:hypothetical protein